MGHKGPARLSCQSPWGAGPLPAAGHAAPPAGRRSGPKGQAGASAGGLAGAPPSHPRRSGGPYRRHAARRRCAAAAPWERMGATEAVGAGLNKIALFCTPGGPWLGGPQPTTRTHSARPGHGPRGLANCGVAGLCTRHRPGGGPAIMQNNCFVQAGPSKASGLSFGGGASPGWRHARPPGPASGAPLALGRGAGGSGELI